MKVLSRAKVNTNLAALVLLMFADFYFLSAPVCSSYWQQFPAASALFRKAARSIRGSAASNVLSLLELSE